MLNRRKEIIKIVEQMIEFAQHCLENPQDHDLHFHAHCHLPEMQLEIEHLLTPWPVILWRRFQNWWAIDERDIPF